MIDRNAKLPEDDRGGATVFSVDPPDSEGALRSRLLPQLRPGLRVLQGPWQGGSPPGLRVQEVPGEVRHAQGPLHALRWKDRVVPAATEREGTHLHDMLLRQRGVPQRDALQPRHGRVRWRRYPVPRQARGRSTEDIYVGMPVRARFRRLQRFRVTDVYFVPE